MSERADRLRAAMTGADWYRVRTGDDNRLQTIDVPHVEHVARCRAAVPDATDAEILAAIADAEQYARWRDRHIWPLLYGDDDIERRA